MDCPDAFDLADAASGQRGCALSGPACTLLVYVDDATSRLMQLLFVSSESTFTYFEATRGYLERYGKPLAFYSDKASVFRINKQAIGGDGQTQFGRAMNELNITDICANTSSAKGRVERAHLTLISGRVVGTNDANKMLELRCEKTKQQLEDEWRKSDPVTYSQHSSIVANHDVPKMAMAYDLAIGQCLAFELQGGQFWNSLLWRADWRNKNNPNGAARTYYQTGILPLYVTKKFMNKADEILPTGKFGVVNAFYNASKVIPARYPEVENKEVARLQWDMPK